MQTAESQRARLDVPVPCLVEVVRDLRPMQASIEMVNDMVSVIEGGLIHRCVHAVVSETEVALAIFGVDEDVLRPISKGHHRHREEVWNNEHPHSGQEIHVCSEKANRSHPSHTTESHRTES